MKRRVSKFELLRIIAMYLIVLHHAVFHGILTYEQRNGTIISL